jgi:nitrate reductase alpha subunit
MEPKKRVGRPPKVEKRAIGRPKGEAAIMKGYRERMLNSPKSRKVLDSIFAAALDDDHKNQAAAWKIVVDRIVPVSSFEKEAGSGGRASIQVNITGVPGINLDTEDAIDGTCEEV